MSKKIQAITFDFWRTLFYAHSRLDERRAARVAAIVEATGVAGNRVAEAFSVVSQEFLRIHIAEQRTLQVEEAIPMLEEQLRIKIHDERANGLTEALSDAFLLHPPEALEGALEAVKLAAEMAPVGIISDTGLTPGSRIRALLEREGFAEYVRVYAFSDEVGVAKPQAAMFYHAADHLGVSPDALLHVGDLEPTDVAGALNVKALPILFAGDNNRYIENTRAKSVYLSWQAFQNDLPCLVD